MVHVPSVGNLRAYRIKVVRETDGRKAFEGAAHGQEFLIRALLALVFLACPKVSRRQYGDRGRELYTIQDATIACL